MCHNSKLTEYINILLFSCILVVLISGQSFARFKNNLPRDSTKTMIQDVKDFSKKDNFFSRQLKNIIVRDEEQYEAAAPVDPDRSIIKKYTGKFIRYIRVEKLDVFGASVNDPEDSVRTWFQNGSNSLHVDTKDWIIKDMLIFSEGQVFVPFHILESERIIRLTPYIYDVRIVPQEISSSSDSVDIIVYTQDIWSINGSADLNKSDKSGRVSFNDLNFLGYGNEFKGGLRIDRALRHGWGWEGSYTYNNIRRTFLSAKVYYLTERNREQYGLMIGRDFFSPVIGWAGGVSQDWHNVRYPDLLNQLQQAETIRLNRQDYWVGYAFDLKPFDPNTVNQNKFNIAARIIRTVFSQKPLFDSMDVFQDNTFILGRLGYSYRIYYQDRFIFGLGRTEDIPLIKMIEFLFGVEKGSNTSRPYYGLKTGYSFNKDKFGYLYGGFQIGAFRSEGQWLNRTSILELLYFSKLNSIGNYKWRHYIGSRYLYSFDPLRPGDILNINNEGGLRGFSDGDLLGNKKIILNYENNIFVPLKFLGFKIALITFADFGLIASNNNSLLSSKFFQGYGIGFRIKNEHLIFPPFQFMFAFYPNTRQGGELFNFFRQSTIYYHFNRFQFSTPSVITTQ